MQKHGGGRRSVSRLGHTRVPRGMTTRQSLVTCADQAGLSDLGRGLDAVIQILCLGEECIRTSGLRKWATVLIRYIRDYSQDIPKRMSECKRYFAICRENALQLGKGGWGTMPPPPIPSRSTAMEKRLLLHQISRVSRSLRQPTDAVVKDSLREHLVLCQTDFKTPEDLRTRFRAFVKSHFGSSVVAGFSGVNPSSSYLRTKAMGGVPEEIKEITDTYRSQKVTFFTFLELVRDLPSFVKSEVSAVYNSDSLRVRLFDGESRSTGLFVKTVEVGDVLFPYDKASELSAEDWEAKREILFSLAACWSSIDPSSLPKCRQVPIKERGFKTRVATPLEAPFRYLLGVVNSGLLTCLESVPAVTNALHGRPAEKLDWSKGTRKNLVLSADLKAATDHFPQDLMLDAIDELSLFWPPEIRFLAKRAVGPHSLLSHSGEQEVVTSRGILMGSPVSWPLLSMYSAWLHEESGSDGWFGVCGDDYIGCHTRATLAKYNSTRLMTGAIPSPGKDTVATQFVGVFAEDLVTVGRGRVHNTVSVRAVLGDSKPDRPSWTQGPEIAQALSYLKLKPAVEGRVCGSLHKASFQRLRRAGIDPSAPRWCGGAGFSGIPQHSSYVCARQLVSQSQELVTQWVTEFESAWSAMGACRDLLEAVREDISRHADSQWDSGAPGKWGPLRDVVALRLGTLSWPFFLAGALPRQLRVSLGSVRKKIGEVKAAIAQKGYWVPTGETIRNGEALGAMLNSLEPRSRPIRFSPITQRITLMGSGDHQSYARKRRLAAVGGPNWGSSPGKKKMPKVSS